MQQLQSFVALKPSWVLNYKCCHVLENDNLQLNQELQEVLGSIVLSTHWICQSQLAQSIKYPFSNGSFSLLRDSGTWTTVHWLKETRWCRETCKPTGRLHDKFCTVTCILHAWIPIPKPSDIFILNLKQFKDFSIKLLPKMCKMCHNKTKQLKDRLYGPSICICLDGLIVIATVLVACRWLWVMSNFISNHDELSVHGKLGSENKKTKHQVNCKSPFSTTTSILVPSCTSVDFCPWFVLPRHIIRKWAVKNHWKEYEGM